jgi:hypothetical protein
VRKAEVRRYAPVAVILVLVAVPLAIWAATSGGSDDEKEGLIVERLTGLQGEPELVLSIAGDPPSVPAGTSSVEVECTDAEGRSILKSTQPWPFVEEPGYPYPHAHQSASPEEVQSARRCRVLGTQQRLEAAVQ